ncbi:24314_t:CDS:2 [Gigaspora rosea]|nr:24314_t:CDS:2 [Gigaspora rosea]
MAQKQDTYIYTIPKESIKMQMCTPNTALKLDRLNNLKGLVLFSRRAHEVVAVRR